jgi:hypothetical protein
MTYIFRKAHTRGEKGHNGKSLTSLTSLTELDHDWQAQHPRRDRSPPAPRNHYSWAGLERRWGWTIINQRLSNHVELT